MEALVEVGATMNEIQTFFAGGACALISWGLGLILNMGKGAVSEITDF